MFVVVFCVAISVCVCVGLNLRIHDKKKNADKNGSVWTRITITSLSWL